jgi:hypothetical protein
MKDFPYHVNRCEGTYFDRNGFQIDDSVMKPHYYVGYEGNDPRLSAWQRKQSKGLTNFAIFFEGNTAEDKRLIIWHKLQTKTWDRRLARFFNQFREEPLFLWYLSSYNLPLPNLSSPFCLGIFNNNLTSSSEGVTTYLKP